MHIEYRNFLIQLQSDWLKDAGFDPLAISNFQVLTPPPNAAAFVGSNIAFSLARKIGLEPVTLCRQLAEFGNSGESSSFILLPSASGYLNALPKKDLIKVFVQKAAEEISKSNFLIYNQLQTLNKIQNNQNPDLKKLLRLKSNLSRSDRYQALALLGDQELAVDSYLLGLNGKENIGWLLGRFSTDWRLVKSRFNAGGLSDFAPLILSELSSNPLILGEANDFSQLEGVLRYQLLALLSIRSFESLDRLFSFCLSLVNSFYSYYNLPYFRAGLQTAGSPLWSAVAEATELLGLLVQEVSNAPFFSCDN